MADKNRFDPTVPPAFRLPGTVPSGNFRGIAMPSENFNAIQNQLRSPPLGLVLDLSTARSIAAGSQFLLGVAGNSFYVDAAADVGNASIRFQDTSLDSDQPALFVGPQFIARVPFTRIMFENTAQPGKVLRFFYGVDIDFTPGLNNQVVITGNVSVVGVALSPANILVGSIDGGYSAGVYFASSTALTPANTPQNIIAAGGNANGYLLHDAGAFIQQSAGGSIMGSFLAKATAPANSVDGQVLAITQFEGVAATPVSHGTVKLTRACRVAAGLRLDRITTASAESVTEAFANYTLF